MRVLGGTELLLCRLVGEEVDGVLGGHQLLPRGVVHQLSMYTLAECPNSYTATLLSILAKPFPI